MNRQNIRKLILIIQEAMEGIVSGSFIVFVCMLLASIFFGRIFCGWLCPMGDMQECLFSVNEKVPKQGSVLLRKRVFCHYFC